MDVVEAMRTKLPKDIETMILNFASPYRGLFRLVLADIKTIGEIHDENHSIYCTFVGDMGPDLDLIYPPAGVGEVLAVLRSGERDPRYQ